MDSIQQINKEKKSYFSTLEFNILFGYFDDYINFITFLNKNIKYKTLYFSSDIKLNYFECLFYITGYDLETSVLCQEIDKKHKQNIILDKIVIIIENFDDNRTERFYIGEENEVSEFKYKETLSKIDEFRTIADKIFDFIPQKNEKEYYNILVSIDKLYSNITKYKK